MSNHGSSAPAVENGEKTEQKPKGEQINIVVKDQNSNELTFKIKKTTKFEKVFAAWCNMESKEPKSVRFSFDGSRVNPNDTPGALDMEDGDIVEVFLEQMGGTC
ncbi:ubiquitin-related domain-containing protein [Calycina marina]|uniref:Ubiquitin-related domain-containing protein n=1 Tax=Calycina marina TaxID=1763456 RepID=A0A9P8CE01_9HELO|nr:ubiquitin-related domain-containing protein [Calycina marina]